MQTKEVSSPTQDIFKQTQERKEKGVSSKSVSSK
jgi:hypothetical protein